MEDNEVPKWANFICPSCALSYGVNALIKAIRKRQQKEKRLHQNTTNIQ
ncbi:MAG: hypothetical protein M3Y53_02130 [Thermoproteota archaeon]|nr:hypothetical protein [Thermoproteota archaeon]